MSEWLSWLIAIIVAVGIPTTIILLLIPTPFGGWDVSSKEVEEEVDG